MDGWYGHVLYVGEHEGYPILTFSNNLPREKISFNPPHTNYITTIIAGLKQMDLDQDSIVSYFKDMDGIRDYLSIEKLREVRLEFPDLIIFFKRLLN